MMRKLLLVIMVGLISSVSLFAQKKALDETVYDSWNQVGQALLSNDGNYSVYIVNPQEGDGVLYVRDNKNDKTTSFERGSAPMLFNNGEWVSFKIKKPLELTRKYEIDNVKKDKQEQDSVILLRFSDMKQKVLVGTQSFKTSKDGSLVAWTKADKKENAKKDEKKDKDSDEPKPYNFGKLNTLTILDVNKDLELAVVEGVAKYEVASDGSSVIYDMVKDENRTVNSVVVNKKGATNPQLADLGYGSVLDMTYNKDGDLIAFSATKDSTKVKKYDIYYGNNNLVSVVVSSLDSKMPKDFSVKGSLSIDVNDRVVFGIEKVEEPFTPKKVSKDQKFSFDLWSWQDTLLQTQQMASSKGRINNHTYTALYSPKTKSWVRVSDKYFGNVSFSRFPAAKYAMLTDSYKYTWWSSITSPAGNDIYIIDLENNSKELVLERQLSSASLSVTSKYILYWNVDDQHWYTYDNAKKVHTKIATDIEYPLYDELHDTPNYARPYGIVGWTEGDKAVLIKDGFDIYKVDPTGVAASENITKVGRTTNTTFTPVMRFYNPEQLFIDLKDAHYFQSFDKKTRDGGFYVLKSGKMSKLVDDNHIYNIAAKAKDSDKVMFTKENYNLVPDMYIADMANIADAKKITDINPQYADYKWGSVELTTWTDFNGDEVEGLLYLPEGYSKDKTYPTIVYFYERNTQTLNKFHTPQPAWSIIIPSMCVSNGYVVFIPDIKYTTGYPGKSSYDAIVSGTMALIERGITDKEHVGLQGQSWGGYASAYLVTQTDLYACAAPGAPVSNMTSAYGGIRWGSGMARSFQYENTQSRIGATPWERRDLYIDNSPLFFADKVNTPLFIRHDDADEAVPWYQGIEYYIALRRLGKPVWMINYNNEPHNLKNRYARKDFAKRLYQFLDVYLKDADMPRWMVEGIDHKDKGKEFKFDLVETK